MSSSDYSMGLRSFLAPKEDPLSINQLKSADRHRGYAESELRSPFTSPSSVSSYSSTVVQNGRVQSIQLLAGEHDGVLAKRVDNLPEIEPGTSRSAPICSNGEMRRGSTGSHRSSVVHRRRATILKSRPEHEINADLTSLASDRAADNEVSDTMDGSAGSQKWAGFMVPNKWQVLYYVANTNYLRIVRTGAELQVLNFIALTSLGHRLCEFPVVRRMAEVALLSLGVGP